MMADPLAEIVTLLQPSASFSKLVEYTGRWRIRRDVEGKPVYFAVLEGQCRLALLWQIFEKFGVFGIPGTRIA
jgi:hypothetical protein